MAMSDAPERAALGGKGRWLQLGLLSATTVAPLIARWRSLREDDRAQAMRERAEAMRERASARFSSAAQAAQSFQQSLQQSLHREDLRNGLRQAGQVTADARERLALLAPSAASDEASRRRAVRASLWLAGVSAGLIAAGAITYIVIRNRALARAENDTLVELSLDHLAGGPPTAPAPSERPITEAPPSREPGLAPPPAFSDEDGDGAAWVGDIYTRAYTSLDALDALDGAALPDHDRRIYFASEEQARAAGYHRAGEAPAERE